MIEQFLNNKLPKTNDRFELLEFIISTSNIKKIAEIGVFKGILSAYLLYKCIDIEEYIMVDPWRNLENWNKPLNTDNNTFNQWYNEAVANTKFAEDKIKIIRGTTLEAVKSINDDYLDACYIDGDHTLKGISADLIATWPLIKNGGLVIGDNFTESIWRHNQNFEPSLVFPFALYFAEAVSCPITILPHNQFVIAKDFSGYRIVNLSNKNYKHQNILEHLNSADKKNELTTSTINLKTTAKKVLPKKIISILSEKRRKSKAIESHTLEANNESHSINSFDCFKCIYVHIPKTAGISISRALFSNFGPAHKTIKDYQKLYSKRTFDSYFKFAIVRNPWDRLYSAYSFLTKGGMNEYDKAFFITNMAHLASFEDFVMNWLNENTLRSYIHFVPQTDFILDANGECKLDFIGRFENLDSDFKIIANKINQNAVLLHLNKTDNEKTYIKEYTEEMKFKVGNLYASDVSFLNYKFDNE